MYKKIALAALVIAPLLAEAASRLTPHSDASPMPDAPVAVAEAPAPPPRQAVTPAALPNTALSQQAPAFAGPFDPVPTLDPTQIANPVGMATPDAPPPQPAPAPATAESADTPSGSESSDGGNQ